jgi:hypothetical protein
MAMRRQICERAVFDGSADDPRVLVHWYQQRMRAQLMASVAAEAAATVVVEKPSLWANYLGSLTSAVRGLVPTKPAKASAKPTLASIHTFPGQAARAARPTAIAA